MNKEEIESLFKKYKVRIPKEKQGQSECYECKRHHKYSLTWTSFLYEYKENYYCFEHIVNILLQQENQELKKQYCERTDCSGRLGNSKKVDQLEKELEQLKEIEKEHQRKNGCLHLEIKELKDRIDKAVEYIEKHTENIDRGKYYEDYVETYYLLKILIGGKE